MMNVIGREFRSLLREYISGYRKNKTKVRSFVDGKITQKEFLLDMLVNFIFKFIYDGLAALGVCYILNISPKSVIFYVAARISIFIISIVRMIFDELTRI